MNLGLIAIDLRHVNVAATTVIGVDRRRQSRGWLPKGRAVYSNIVRRKTKG